MSKHFFRAMRDFVVHLPLYLRAFAIFLIFASPVLATLYFYRTLDHFNKVTYHVPSFALLTLSAIIFYGLRKYFDYDLLSREPGADYITKRNYPAMLASVSESQSCCFFIGIIFFPRPL
jgi:hypothetical protein